MLLQKKFKSLNASSDEEILMVNERSSDINVLETVQEIENVLKDINNSLGSRGKVGKRNQKIFNDNPHSVFRMMFTRSFIISLFL